MFPEIVISIVVSAFILEFFDSALGMGFGTLTSVLILMGYPPLEVIPAVLFCSAVLSLLSGFFHHTMKNIDFFEKQNISVLTIFLGFGIVSIILGAFVAVNIPEFLLDLYVGLLTLIVGIIIILKFKVIRNVSLKRITAFASVASLNKGITGGGFGPVLSGGQIISGVESKTAIGITQLTEGILSIIGVLAHVFFQSKYALNWSLVSSLLIGGLFSVPIAVYTVKLMNPIKIRSIMGVVCISLGFLVLFKAIF